jgi:hypothetical protein
MLGILEGKSSFVQTETVMLETGVALHRAVYAKRHGLELKAVPKLIRLNGNKLDCRTSNLAPMPSKYVPANLVVVPNAEMRSIVTEYGEVLDPYLIPAKYVPEARRVGIHCTPDKHARHCRACREQITTKEDFLAILIQRRDGSPPTKGFLHLYECTPKDQELPNSLSLPECWARRQEYENDHPELYPQREPDNDGYGYTEDDEPDLPTMVYVSTAVRKLCPFCEEVAIGLDDFEESCNHLISEHGMICLHVGSETDRDDDGALIHSTVAVFSRTPLGKTTTKSSDQDDPL